MNASEEFNAKKTVVINTKSAKRRRTDEDTTNVVLSQGDRSTEFRPQDLVKMTGVGCPERFNDWQKMSLKKY